jgi:1,6-anhydro-N-acetylmuramate kinase
MVTILHFCNNLLGQTIWHEVVEEKEQLKVISTLQIGEPSVIAQETGVTTVADFRVR